jgi:hypothetical protein
MVCLQKHFRFDKSDKGLRVLIPTVDFEGEVGEVNVDERREYWVRSRLTGELSTWVNEVDPPITANVKREVFRLKRLQFAVSKIKWASVSIYVSEDFLKEKGPARDDAIDAWAKKFAPWFFTYGERTEDKLSR